MATPHAAVQVAVLGSLNMDVVIRMARAPRAGETIEAHGMMFNPGGKGGNQAVACARLGASVAMVGCVGCDAFGNELVSVLAADGIDTRHVRAAGPTSGVAVIFVDDAAENRIAIVGGANAAVCGSDADAAAHLLGNAAMTVLQLEVPLEAVARAAQIAHAAGRRVLLNPTPVRPLPDFLWSLVDVLVVNENEAESLAGLRADDPKAALRAAVKLRSFGPPTVIVTLGASGVVCADEAGARSYPAPAVEAIDTTAAGDTFIGGLTAALVAGECIDAAIERGIEAAAICVTRPGAQVSIPHLHELRPVRLAS